MHLSIVLRMLCTIKFKRINYLENRFKKAVSLEGPLSHLSLTGGGYESVESQRLQGLMAMEAIPHAAL